MAPRCDDPTTDPCVFSAAGRAEGECFSDFAGPSATADADWKNLEGRKGALKAGPTADSMVVQPVCRLR